MWIQDKSWQFYGLVVGSTIPEFRDFRASLTKIFKWDVKIPIIISLINSDYSSACHNLTLQNPKKASSYGRIVKLWQAASSYGGLLWFKKIKAISTMIFQTSRRIKVGLMHFWTHNEEESKKEIETHQKLCILSDKETSSRAILFKNRSKPPQRSKSRRKWQVFFWKRNWINHENPFIFQQKFWNHSRSP